MEFARLKNVVNKISMPCESRENFATNFLQAELIHITRLNDLKILHLSNIMEFYAPVSEMS